MEEDYEILKKVFIDKEKENIHLKEELNMLKSKMGTEEQTEGSGINLELLRNKNAEDEIHDRSYVSNVNLNTLISTFLKKEDRGKDAKDTEELFSQSFMSKDRSKSHTGRDSTRTLPNFKMTNRNMNLSTLSKDTCGNEISQIDMTTIKGAKTPRKTIETDPRWNNSLLIGKLIEDRSKTTRHNIAKSVNAYPASSDFAQEPKSNPGNYNSTFADNQIQASIPKGEIKKNENNDIEKIKLAYEKKFEDIVKKNEEDKLEIKKQIEKKSDKENSTKSNSVFDKKERIEFQKKYLNEMKEIQQSFEDFKIKTKNEINNLKKQKQEAITEANFFKQSIEQMKEEQQDYIESLIQENSSLKKQLESMKGHEDLKYQNECLVNENNYLRMRLAQYDGAVSDYQMNAKYSNKKNRVVCSKSIKSSNLQLNPNVNYFAEDTGINLMSNKASDIVNFDNSRINSFSPITARENTNTDSDNYCSQLEIAKTNQRLKQMEECLKCLTDENEQLREKLTNVIGSITQESKPPLSQSKQQKISSSFSNVNMNKTAPFFQAQICDDPISYKDLHPGTSESTRRTAVQSNNSDAQLKMNTACKNIENKMMSNTMISQRSLNSGSGTNKNDNSQVIQFGSTNQQWIKNECTSNEDLKATHESLEDNIIEFPLQIKIKGKIKKISTEKRK